MLHRTIATLAEILRPELAEAVWKRAGKGCRLLIGRAARFQPLPTLFAHVTAW